MKTRILIFINKMYLKWIKGQCRHLCCNCKYKEQCLPEYEELIKESGVKW